MMKSTLAIAVVAAVQEYQEGFIPLHEVIGRDFASNGTLKSGFSIAHDERPQTYWARRNPEDCIYPFEVILIQDCTDSFSDNLSNFLEDQLDQLFDFLDANHPGSRFGLISFRDKRMSPYGYNSDWWSTVELPLTDDAREPIRAKYSKLYSAGGQDAPENQFGSLIQSIKSPMMKWTSPEESKYTRLVVMVTDAAPHNADDGANNQNLERFPDTWSDDLVEDYEFKYYYPSAVQVRDALQESQTYLATLVYDGDWANGWASQSWQSFNRFIGQSEDFVEDIDREGASVFRKVSEIINAITELECVDESTEAPTVDVTEAPTVPVTETPTVAVTEAPTVAVTEAPTVPVTETPSVTATEAPTVPMTDAPTEVVTTSPEVTEDCPPCPSVGPCDPCAPEIVIEILRRPDEMQLIVRNNIE